MESSVIELLKQVTLQKENCDPFIFEAGTVLKVVMQTPTILLVSNDDDFNFTIPLIDEYEMLRVFILFIYHANIRDYHLLYILSILFHSSSLYMLLLL